MKIIIQFPNLFLVSIISLFSLGFTPIDDTERLSDFWRHKNSTKLYDLRRESSEADYVKMQLEWDKKKKKELEEYRNQKKVNTTPTEYGPEHKEWLAQKKVKDLEYEKSRRIESEKKQAWTHQKKNNSNLVSEMQEYDLDKSLLKYDYKKRALYGAKPRYGKFSLGGGSSSSGGSGGGSKGLPAPNYDDFGGSGGYVPTPNIEPYYDPGIDIPIPAPTYDGSGDIQPPPPPPPPMDEFAPDINF